MDRDGCMSYLHSIVVDWEDLVLLLQNVMDDLCPELVLFLDMILVFQYRGLHIRYGVLGIIMING